jgi:hypothetical protein
LSDAELRSRNSNFGLSESRARKVNQGFCLPRAATRHPCDQFPRQTPCLAELAQPLFDKVSSVDNLLSNLNMANNTETFYALMLSNISDLKFYDVDGKKEKTPK